MTNPFRKHGMGLCGKLMRLLAIGLLLLVLGLFIDWLIFNLYLGCCEGGVCWPDIYPQCRNKHFREFYGDDYGKSK